MSDSKFVSMGFSLVCPSYEISEMELYRFGRHRERRDLLTDTTEIKSARKGRGTHFLH